MRVRNVGTKGEVGFEIDAPAIDEVIADVGGAIVHRSGGRGLSGVFDRFQRHAYLAFAARQREFFNSLPLLVAAEKVHAAVRARWISLQDPLDETHRLEVLLPVQRRAETQAHHHVRHRHLRHALALMLAANRLFGSGLLQPKMVIDRAANGGEPGAVLAEPVEQMHDERGIGIGGQRGVGGCVGFRDVIIGRAAGGARG